ncbi:MAG TPA: nitrate reductase molybdenum cofactor assembly chaperone [Candidatus Nanopelagicales bacterium]|nr:nitrate reductase molybdenum cofactor assembly chaperone [Candidatus Nanopelagicales bacterium]
MTVHHDEREVRRLLAAASMLLCYPEASTIDRLALVDRSTPTLPHESREPIARFAAWLSSVDLIEAQSHYVEIFDRRRKACLYLTYFLNGDTRRRGMALVEFKEAYQTAGFDVPPSELPDFLPVVLEFGSVGDLAVALEQLARHRAGLEVLEKALRQFGSPYADVVTALLPVVPPAPAGPTAEELAFSGPPAEQVGLAPFVPLESLKVGARA